MENSYTIGKTKSGKKWHIAKREGSDKSLCDITLHSTESLSGALEELDVCDNCRTVQARGCTSAKELRVRDAQREREARIRAEQRRREREEAAARKSNFMIFFCFGIPVAVIVLSYIHGPAAFILGGIWVGIMTVGGYLNIFSGGSLGTSDRGDAD